MIKNYLKIAFRNLRRHPFYAFVNIFGLALGIACCILIALFIRDEWSYDTFHEDADRIYRVALHEQYEDHEYLNVVTPYRFASMFEDNFPEVEAAVRFTRLTSRIQQGATQASENVYLADAGFFEVFDFPLLAGQAEDALSDINNIVLTETAARQWFGAANPMGRTLTLDLGGEQQDFIVAGIAADTPSNSSIRFDYLIPGENIEKIWDERALRNLFSVFAETFIRLPEGYEIAQLEAKMPALIQREMGDEYVPGSYVPRFQLLTDIHLDTSYPGGSQPVSDPRYSYILAIIASFVLVIACINFMTLTIARSTDRAKEVGVRKALGAMRKHVMGQFWGEAVWFSVLGLLMGTALAVLVLPLFETLAEKELAFTFDLSFGLLLLGLVAVVGLIAGSYPALFLSKFQPISVLKGRLRVENAGLVRKGLSVIQFSLAILLIIATLVIKDQLDFLQNRSLGFDREQLVSIETGMGRQEGMQLLERFRTEMANHPEIVATTASVFTFGERWIFAGYESDDGAFRQFQVNIVDYDFLKTMEIPLVGGRDFSRAISADEREAIIVNRAFAELHGWEDPVGRQLPSNAFSPHIIIGMVDNFHFESLHEAVAPLALILTPEPLFAGLDDIGMGPALPKFLVRLSAGNVAEGLDVAAAAWEQTATGMPFTFSFVDDAVDQQYRQEERLGKIVEYATLLVVLIACLGLFGLASLSIARRTKEIGVRKVLGASVHSIVLLLSKEFIKLVLIAFVITAPVAWLLLRDWLSDFAFATNLSLWTFLLAGGLAVLAALITVSYQSIRAATSNPVRALRYE